jgi:hypothetical protein
MSKKLIEKILKASESIHKASIKGSGNYMVTSPAVANIIRGFRRGYRKEKIKKLFPDE